MLFVHEVDVHMFFCDCFLCRYEFYSVLVPPPSVLTSPGQFLACFGYCKTGTTSNVSRRMLTGRLNTISMSTGNRPRFFHDNNLNCNDYFIYLGRIYSKG